MLVDMRASESLVESSEDALTRHRSSLIGLRQGMLWGMAQRDRTGRDGEILHVHSATVHTGPRLNLTQKVLAPNKPRAPCGEGKLWPKN